MLGLTILKLFIVAATILSLLIVPGNSTAFFTGIFIFSGSLINDYANLIYTTINGKKMSVQKVAGCLGLSLSFVYLLLSVAGFMNIIKLVSNNKTVMLVPGEISGSTIVLPDFSIPIYFIVWPLAIFMILTLFELVFSFKRTDIRRNTTNNVGGAKNEC